MSGTENVVITGFEPTVMRPTDRIPTSANHTVDVMARDYEGLLARAAARPAPAVADLPAHFTDDHSATARALAGQFGLALDGVLPPLLES